MRFVIHQLGLGLSDGGQEWASGDPSSRPFLTPDSCEVCASVSSFVKGKGTFLRRHSVAALSRFVLRYFLVRLFDGCLPQESFRAGGSVLFTDTHIGGIGEH